MAAKKSSESCLRGISLNCRTIRIGSYEYTPTKKVYISTKGIKIVAPSVKNESRDVAFQIQMADIVKVLVHFGQELPVIFLYTMSQCGAYIRKALDMTHESGPYFNPTSEITSPFKKITLLFEIITKEAKMTLKALFAGKLMDELNCREANEILVRARSKQINNVTKTASTSTSASVSSGATSRSPAEVRQILIIYPPGRGGIPVTRRDYKRLARGRYLNDVIIDFYLKYLVHDVLTERQREKTHIFSTFFYERLTTININKNSNPHVCDSSSTAAQSRHSAVKTWTKKVNIFEKDFIVVPINENSHWFVAIICYPGLDGCRSMIDDRIVTPQEIQKRERRLSIRIGNGIVTSLNKQERRVLNGDPDSLNERDKANAKESDLDIQCDPEEEENESAPIKEVRISITRKTEPIKQPCILIFDSSAGESPSTVVETLRDYLTCEYQAKVVAPNKVFNEDNMKGSCPKIPQQNNFTDCGLYLLQYVEQFFKDPIKDYSLPIKQLTNWFDEITVTRKREEISNLLKLLMHEHNPESHLALPRIKLPTLNGKLIKNKDQNKEESDGDEGSSMATGGLGSSLSENYDESSSSPTSPCSGSSAHSIDKTSPCSGSSAHSIDKISPCSGSSAHSIDKTSPCSGSSAHSIDKTSPCSGSSAHSIDKTPPCSGSSAHSIDKISPCSGSSAHSIDKTSPCSGSSAHSIDKTSPCSGSSAHSIDKTSPCSGSSAHSIDKTSPCSGSSAHSIDKTSPCSGSSAHSIDKTSPCSGSSAHSIDKTSPCSGSSAHSIDKTSPCSGSSAHSIDKISPCSGSSAHSIDKTSPCSGSSAHSIDKTPPCSGSSAHSIDKTSPCSGSSAHSIDKTSPCSGSSAHSIDKTSPCSGSSAHSIDKTSPCSGSSAHSIDKTSPCSGSSAHSIDKTSPCSGSSAHSIDKTSPCSGSSAHSIDKTSPCSGSSAHSIDKTSPCSGSSAHSIDKTSPCSGSSAHSIDKTPPCSGSSAHSIDKTSPCSGSSAHSIDKTSPCSGSSAHSIDKTSSCSGSSGHSIDKTSPCSGSSAHSIDKTSPCFGSSAHSIDKTSPCSGSSAHSIDKTSPCSGSSAHSIDKTSPCSGSSAHSIDKTSPCSGSSVHSIDKISLCRGSSAHSIDKISPCRGSSAHSIDKTSPCSGSSAHSIDKTSPCSGSSVHSIDKISPCRGSSAHSIDKISPCRGSSAHSIDKTSPCSGSSAHSIDKTSPCSGSSAHSIDKTSPCSGSSAHSIDKTSPCSGSSAHSIDKISPCSGSSAHSIDKISPCRGSSAHSIDKISPCRGSSAHSIDKTSPCSGSSAHSTDKTSPCSGSSAHSIDKTSPCSGSSVHAIDKTSPCSGSSVHSIDKISPFRGSSAHSIDKTSPCSGSSAHSIDKTSPCSGSSVHAIDKTSPCSGSSVHSIDKISPFRGSSAHSIDKTSPCSGSSAHSIDKPSPCSGSSAHSIDKTDDRDTFNLNPIEPDMRLEGERLKTFSAWPIAFLTPETLAQNGFYYLECSYEVCCAFCKMKVVIWLEGDDPIKDHQPQCPIVRTLSATSDGELGMPGPVHKQYASETARLESFKNWSRCMPRTKDLAEAGFFYTGQDEKTCCFYCGGKIKVWKTNDVPWEQHARWFDMCAYVLLVKGQKYIQQVKSEACIESSEPKPYSLLEYEVATGGPGSSLSTNYDESSLLPTSPYSRSSAHSIDKTDDHDTFNLNPIEPDMHLEGERLKTFSAWPITFLTPKHLAQNGFYYLECSDEVRCAFCKVKMVIWMESDDPIKEHQSQCPFVRTLSATSDGEFGMPGPVHKQYASETARLESFKNWSRCMPRTEDLAEAGFFYTGQDDKTCCFYCGGKIKVWKTNDVPWEQHARWFDRCAYVLLVKGQKYIQQVKSETCIESSEPKKPKQS